MKLQRKARLIALASAFAILFSACSSASAPSQTTAASLASETTAEATTAAVTTAELTTASSAASAATATEITTAEPVPETAGAIAARLAPQLASDGFEIESIASSGDCVFIFCTNSQFNAGLRKYIYRYSRSDGELVSIASFPFTSCAVLNQYTVIGSAVHPYKAANAFPLDYTVRIADDGSYADSWARHWVDVTCDDYVVGYDELPVDYAPIVITSAAVDCDSATVMIDNASSHAAAPDVAMWFEASEGMLSLFFPNATCKASRTLAVPSTNPFIASAEIYAESDGVRLDIRLTQYAIYYTVCGDAIFTPDYFTSGQKSLQQLGVKFANFNESDYFTSSLSLYAPTAYPCGADETAELPSYGYEGEPISVKQSLSGGASVCEWVQSVFDADEYYSRFTVLSYYETDSAVFVCTGESGSEYSNGRDFYLYDLASGELRFAYAGYCSVMTVVGSRTLLLRNAETMWRTPRIFPSDNYYFAYSSSAYIPPISRVYYAPLAEDGYVLGTDAAANRLEYPDQEICLNRLCSISATPDGVKAVYEPDNYMPAGSQATYGAEDFSYDEDENTFTIYLRNCILGALTEGELGLQNIFIRNAELSKLDDRDLALTLHLTEYAKKYTAIGGGVYSPDLFETIAAITRGVCELKFSTGEVDNGDCSAFPAVQANPAISDGFTQYYASGLTDFAADFAKEADYVQWCCSDASALEKYFAGEYPNLALRPYNFIAAMDYYNAYRSADSEKRYVNFTYQNNYSIVFDGGSDTSPRCTLYMHSVSSFAAVDSAGTYLPGTYGAETSYVLSVAKSDGKWLITDIQVPSDAFFSSIMNTGFSKQDLLSAGHVPGEAYANH